MNLAMHSEHHAASRPRTAARGGARPPDVLWQAILDRAPGWDGVLYYAVTTTGVYCRPTCPSRRPRRQNVVLFADPRRAREAGFRACRRCRPDEASPASKERALVVAACHAIDEHESRNPGLAELARGAGMSPGHFRKVFEKLLGITPKQYADALRLQCFRSAVGAGQDVTGALYEAGFGSSSRLYERAGRDLGMTPATYRRRGGGLTVRYRLAPCSLGWLLVAATERGLCKVELGDRREELEESLRRELGRARLVASGGRLDPWVAALTDYLAGSAPLPDLPLDVATTAFQARVYRALRKIPEGSRWTYSEVAAAIGSPRAVRAVAGACARNPVALAIPCHRVVPKRGGAGGYRWGEERKRALLALEERRGGD